MAQSRYQKAIEDRAKYKVAIDESRSRWAPDQNEGTLGDIGTRLAQGALRLPSLATQVADIPLNLLGGQNYLSRGADYLTEGTGFDLDAKAAAMESDISEKGQRQAAEFGATEGFMDAGEFLLKNPAHLGGIVAESLPSMVGGGLAGRGVAALSGLSKTVGAVAGEGAVSAGQQMGALTEQGVDPQVGALAALATGVGVGAVGAAGASLAMRMKLVDPDLALAGVFRTPTATEAAVGSKTLSQRMKAAGPLAGRVAGGALVEGVFEEAPQTAIEGAIGNIATGKPVGEGLGKEIAAGALAGGALGGAMNIRPAPTRGFTPEEDAANARQEIINIEGLGGNESRGATKTLLGITRKEGVHAFLNRRSKTVKDAVMGSEFYKNLPTNEEWRAEQDADAAKQEARAATAAIDEPDIAAEILRQEAGTIEDNAVKEHDNKNAAAVNEILASGVLGAAMNDTTDADNVRRAKPKDFDSATGIISEPRTSAEQAPSLLRVAAGPVRQDINGAFQKEALDSRGLTALSGYIARNTPALVDKFTKKAYDDAVKGVKAAKAIFRSNLSHIIGARGRVKPETRVAVNVAKKGGKKILSVADKPTDPELKAFVTQILKLPADVRLPGKVASAINRRARDLSITHKLPALRTSTAEIVNSVAAVNRAYAPEMITRPVKNTAKRSEDPFDKTDAVDVATIQNLFDHLHDLTRDFDKARDHLGKRTTGKLTKKGTLTSGAAEVSPDLDLVAIKDIAEIRAKQDPTPAEKARVLAYDAEVVSAISMANLAAEGGAGTNVEGLYELTDKINSQLRLIEMRIGRNNLLKAQATGIGALDKNRKATRAKAGKQESEAVRFNIMYASFRDGGVDFGIEEAPIRHTKKLTAKHNKAHEKANLVPEAVKFAGNGAPAVRKKEQMSTRIEDIIEESTEAKVRNDIARDLKLTTAINKGSAAVKTAARKKVDIEIAARRKAGTLHSYPPLQILLESLGQRMSPTTTLMARHLRLIIQQSDEKMNLARAGSLDPRTNAFDDYISRLDLEIHPEASRPSVKGQGSAVGSFTMADANTGNPTIRLWQNGTSPRTIIHEVLHAVTVGIMASPDAQTPNQQALLADLEALRSDVASEYDAEKSKYDEMWGKFRAASADAKKQGKKLETRTQADVKELHDQRRIVQILNILKGDVGLEEFVTYGMTEPSFIAWMKNRKAPAGFLDNKEEIQGKTWWSVFAHKLKLLLGGGIAAIKDSIFESFVDASSGLLGEVYQASEQGNEIFDYQEGARTFDSVATFEKDWPGKYSPEDVGAAAGDYSEGQDSLSKSAKAARKLENDAKLEAVVTDSVVRAAEAKRAKKDVTTTMQRKNSKDLTVIDKFERMMLNGLTNFGTGGKYTSYEKWAQETLLDKNGVRIVKSLENKNDRWIVTAVGKLLSKTVDQLGTPIGFRNIMHTMGAEITGGLNIAYSAYESTVSFTDDMQLGIIDYINNQDEVSLRARLQDDAKVKTVLDVIASLESTLATAKRLGRVHPDHIHDNLSEFLNLAKGGSFVIKSKANIGVLKPVSLVENRLQVAGISEFVLIGRDGVEITPQDFDNDPARMRNLRFMHGKNTPEGHDVFIEEGADTAVWDINRAAPAMSSIYKDRMEARPYKINGAANSVGEFTLSRQKTPQEHHQEGINKYGDTAKHRSDKERAVVMSALTELMQDWNHSIEGYLASKNLLDLQEGLLEEDGTDNRFILDATPENRARLEEDIPTNRLFDFRKQDDATSKTALSMLRIPGSWVRLPDDSSAEALMGDLKGKYVAGPVYMSMRDFYDKSPIIDSETFRAALAAWKINKTALSTTAHINNVLGNVTLAYYHDIPAKNISVAAKIVIKKMFRPESMTQFEEDMWQEMSDMGITLVAAKTADFDVEATQKLNVYLKDKASSHRSLLKAYTALETVASTSVDLYSNQDNIFRLALYMTTIQNDPTFMETNVATAELKQQAARKATEGFVDYQIHAPWVKAARGSLLPFIAWPYRMVPLMFKLMITKPWKAANTVATISAVNAAAYAFLGASDDDEDYEQSVQPEWYQRGVSWLPGVPSNIRLPFGAPGEEANFISLSRSIPLADITDFSGSGMPSVISIGGPAGILGSILMNHDPFTGKEITNGTEDIAGWVAKEAAFVAKGVAPGALTNVARFAGRQGETGPLGYEYDFWVESARALGISIFQMNIPEAAFSKDLSRQSVERKFKMEMGRRWRNELRKKNPDFDDAADDVEGFQNRMMAHIQELTGDFGEE